MSKFVARILIGAGGVVVAYGALTVALAVDVQRRRISRGGLH